MILINNNIFCVKFDSKFIIEVKKYLLNIKTINLNYLSLLLCNYNNSSICFNIENTNTLEISIGKIQFYKIEDNLNNIVGNSMNIENQIENNICKDNQYISFQITVTDLIKIFKCLSSNENVYLLFNFQDKVVKMSGISFFSILSISDENILLFNKVQERKIEFDQFCHLEEFIKLLEYSHIVCSNAYGRIINKATCFVNIDNNFYCINTNGRILVIKQVNTEFRKKFSISIYKNVFKFFTGLNKDTKVFISLQNNLCTFKCENIIIEFVCVDQEHNIYTLFQHHFDKQITIQEYVINNVFNFFNQVKGITMENSIEMYKITNSKDIKCYITDKGNKLESIIGNINQEHTNLQFNIKLGFDVFELIKLIIKKIISEKNFEINLLFNTENANFASLNYKNNNAIIFFAVR